MSGSFWPGRPAIARPLGQLAGRFYGANHSGVAGALVANRAYLQYLDMPAGFRFDQIAFDVQTLAAGLAKFAAYSPDGAGGVGEKLAETTNDATTGVTGACVGTLAAAVTLPRDGLILSLCLNAAPNGWVTRGDSWAAQKQLDYWGGGVQPLPDGLAAPRG
jgi:hypothetical protein